MTSRKQFPEITKGAKNDGFTNETNINETKWEVGLSELGIGDEM